MALSVMMKILILIIGIEVIFMLGGLPTGSATILNEMGLNITNPSSFQNMDASQSDASHFIGVLLFILAGVAVSGITIGILTKQNPDFYLLVPLAVVFIGFTYTVISVITLAYSFDNWTTYVVGAILIPILFIFPVSVINWWTNRQ